MALNPLPFQYMTRAPMVEHMRNETMRSQLAEAHDQELEDYLGRLFAYVASLEARIEALEP
jgi:hypothetical protein